MGYKKNYLVEKCKMSYGIDLMEELKIYKSLYGRTNKKKDSFLVKDILPNGTYKDWKRHVREKCKSLNSSQLEDLTDTLEMILKTSAIGNKSVEMIAAVGVAVLFDCLWDLILEYMKMDMGNSKLLIIVLVLGVAITISIIMVGVIKIIIDYFDNQLREQFYKDIIKTVKKSKNRCKD